jgi:hypothetical protein
MLSEFVEGVSMTETMFRNELEAPARVARTRAPDPARARPRAMRSFSWRLRWALRADAAFRVRAGRSGPSRTWEPHRFSSRALPVTFGLQAAEKTVLPQFPGNRVVDSYYDPLPFSRDVRSTPMTAKKYNVPPTSTLVMAALVPRTSPSRNLCTTSSSHSFLLGRTYARRPANSENPGSWLRANWGKEEDRGDAPGPRTRSARRLRRRRYGTCHRACRR